jgi:hypothetical protein
MNHKISRNLKLADVLLYSIPFLSKAPDEQLLLINKFNNGLHPMLKQF